MHIVHAFFATPRAWKLGCALLRTWLKLCCLHGSKRILAFVKLTHQLSNALAVLCLDDINCILAMFNAGTKGLFKQLPHSLALVGDLQSQSTRKAKVKLLPAVPSLPLYLAVFHDDLTVRVNCAAACVSCQ